MAHEARADELEVLQVRVWMCKLEGCIEYGGYSLFMKIFVKLNKKRRKNVCFD